MIENRTAVPADIAASILELTYGDLMDIAGLLRDMHTDSPRDLDRPEEWAELLHSWARTTCDAAADEESEARP